MKKTLIEIEDGTIIDVNEIIVISPLIPGNKRNGFLSQVQIFFKGGAVLPFNNYNKEELTKLREMVVTKMKEKTDNDFIEYVPPIIEN